MNRWGRGRSPANNDVNHSSIVSGIMALTNACGRARYSLARLLNWRSLTPIWPSPIAGSGHPSMNEELFGERAMKSFKLLRFAIVAAAGLGTAMFAGGGAANAANPGPIRTSGRSPSTRRPRRAVSRSTRRRSAPAAIRRWHRGWAIRPSPTSPRSRSA